MQGVNFLAFPVYPRDNSGAVPQPCFILSVPEFQAGIDFLE
jgi:hypothetical protein